MQPPDFRIFAKFGNSDNHGHKYNGQTEIRTKTRDFKLDQQTKILISKTNGKEIRISSKSLVTTLLETTEIVVFGRRPKILSPKS